MMFYIQEWSNRTAAIMTIIGQTVCTFPSTDDALKICRLWLFDGEDVHRVEILIKRPGQGEGAAP